MFPSGSLTAATHRLVPIDAKTFGARYAKLQSWTVAGVTVHAAVIPDPEFEDEPEVRQLRAAFAVGRGAATRYYELVNTDGAGMRVMNDPRATSDGAGAARIRVAAAGDPALPLLTFGWTSSDRASGVSSSTKDVLFLDFRGTPRAAQFATCERDGELRGCTAHDLLHSEIDSHDCTWDATRADVVCVETRTLDTGWSTRRSTRRIAVFAGAELPVREHSVASLEALARGPRGEHFVEGIGPVKPAGTLAHRWFVYAAPGTTATMTVRLWSVDLLDPKGPIREVPVQVLDDGEHYAKLDLKLRQIGGGLAAHDEHGNALPRFTPDALPFRIATRRRTSSGAPDVLELVLEEGGSRGVFWIAGDAKSGAVAALRIETDALEYLRCNRFLHPVTASSAAIAQSPFSATLSVVPAWIEDGFAADAQEPATPPRRVRLTWRDGFQISPNQ